MVDLRRQDSFHLSERQSLLFISPHWPTVEKHQAVGPQRWHSQVRVAGNGWYTDDPKAVSEQRIYYKWSTIQKTNDI